MRISYGRVRGFGYNARTGKNVAVCPGGAKKKKYVIQICGTFTLKKTLYIVNYFNDQQQNSPSTVIILTTKIRFNTDLLLDNGKGGVVLGE